MTTLLIVLSLVSLWVYNNAEAIKTKVYGLVPLTPLERLVARFIDLQIWYSLGFAVLAVLSVLE